MKLRPWLQACDDGAASLRQCRRCHEAKPGCGFPLVPPNTPRTFICNVCIVDDEGLEVWVVLGVQQLPSLLCGTCNGSPTESLVNCEKFHNLPAA